MKYERLCLLFFGPQGQKSMGIPGRREGLRILSAEVSGNYVVLDIISPHPEGGKTFYPQKGDPIYGYPEETRVYVEVVDLGKRLVDLDACDFVTVVEHDGVRKAIFASVRA